MKNRKDWFYKRFEEKGYTVNCIAKHMGIKRDSLYRKVTGVNGFSEEDIHMLIKLLNYKFEELFKQK